MLNGIGGRTVAEAKDRMAYAEALDWFSYIRRRGTLNTGLRLEAGFALLASILNNAHGGKAKMADFMPHFDHEDEMSVDSVFKKLQGLK